MNYAKILLALLFALPTLGLTAQIITDRPDVTESAVVVPKGSVQVESGLKYERNGFTFAEKEFSRDHITWNSSLIRFGITNNQWLRIPLELRLGTDYVQSLFVNLTDETYTNLGEGWDPFYAGLKWQLFKEKNSNIDLALLGHIILNKALFNDGMASYNASLAASRSINDYLSLGANFGFEYDPETAENLYTYSASFAMSAPTGFGAFIESFGNFNDLNSNHYMDAGFTYLINPNFQVDLSAGVQLNAEDFNYWFVSGGWSFILPGWQ